MWGKMGHQEILAEHVVDFTKLLPTSVMLLKEFSLPLLRHMASTNTLPHPLVQKRLSIYNREPGPGRGKDDILHERFHVTHFAGCAFLFNKDTFYPDISVKSIYLHDTRRGVQDHIVEGEHGWVLHGVVSRASFRRPPVSTFRCCLYILVTFMPRKKVLSRKSSKPFLAIMTSQDVDLVAGDFNGTAWRCRSRDNLRTIDEVFADCALPTPPPPTIVGTWIHPEQLG